MRTSVEYLDKEASKLIQNLKKLKGKLPDGTIGGDYTKEVLRNKNRGKALGKKKSSLSPEEFTNQKDQLKYVDTRNSGRLGIGNANKAKNSNMDRAISENHAYPASKGRYNKSIFTQNTDRIRADRSTRLKKKEEAGSIKGRIGAFMSKLKGNDTAKSYMKKSYNP